jgi:hypothetical protein
MMSSTESGHQRARTFQYADIFADCPATRISNINAVGMSPWMAGVTVATSNSLEDVKAWTSKIDWHCWSRYERRLLEGNLSHRSRMVLTDCAKLFSILAVGELGSNSICDVNDSLWRDRMPTRICDRQDIRNQMPFMQITESELTHSMKSVKRCGATPLKTRDKIDGAACGLYGSKHPGWTGPREVETLIISAMECRKACSSTFANWM